MVSLGNSKSFELASTQSQEKFITTVQTCGCLISCTYVWPSGEETVSIVPK
jgi:hypothetical protein